MTIYTPKQTDKSEQQSKLIPQVVTEDPVSPPEAPVIAVAAPRRRRSARTNICVIVTAVLVLGIGVIGGIYLYKHLADAHRTFRGWCGVRYYEMEDIGGHKHMRKQKHFGKFEEKVEIDKEGGKYERIEVPNVDDCQRATVLHDFDKNVTAIVDRDNHHCFVMPLNRNVKPPRDFWDLISKLHDRYYIPDVRVVRERFRVLRPPVPNLTVYGFYVWKECRSFDTYRLKKVRINLPHRGNFHRLQKRAAPYSHMFSLALYDGNMRKIDILLD